MLKTQRLFQIKQICLFYLASMLLQNQSSMLTIKSIRLKYSKQLGTQRNKAVRLSFGSTISITKKKPIQLDGQTTQWQENITIPIFFNRPIDIQIFKPHTFGYNPEELDSILSCSVRISNYKQNSCEAFVYNVNKQKIGQLIVKYQVLNQRITLPEDRTKGYLVVSSILVHISQCEAQRGYCEFQTGSDAICTDEINFISNQIMTSQEFTLKMVPQDFQKPLIVNVMTDCKLTHKMNVDITNIKKKPIKYKRMNLYTLQNQKAGYVFIDISYRVKKQQQKKIENDKLNPASSVLLPMLSNRGDADASQGRGSQANSIMKHKSSSVDKFSRYSKSQKLLSAKAEQIIEEKTRKKLYNGTKFLDQSYLIKIFDIGDQSYKKKQKNKQISKQEYRSKNQKQQYPMILPRPIDFNRLRNYGQ